MSFYDTCIKYKDFPDNGILRNDADPVRAIERLDAPNISEEHFFHLLSPGADKYLEEMAQKAHRLTEQYFGKTIQLYTPMYLSNYCDNICVYCGFNAANKIKRRRLTVKEVIREAEFIADKGIRHVLILTGGSRKDSSPGFIAECIRAIKDRFSSICIEIYAMTGDEYGELIKEGIDGLTIYQEVYDEDVYGKVHIAGSKKDYRFRLDAPERAAGKGIRTVNIGALLGLHDWRSEIFFLGLHAKYLQDKYPGIELSISLPRIRPYGGIFKDIQHVSDRDLVHAMVALRIFLPRLGITLSTRESAVLRENLLPLGVTRISAGSTTSVGGRTIPDENNPVQFEICDERDVDDIRMMLLSRGYQPVFKDWMQV